MACSLLAMVCGALALSAVTDVAAHAITPDGLTRIQELGFESSANGCNNDEVALVQSKLALVHRRSIEPSSAAKADTRPCIDGPCIGGSEEDPKRLCLALAPGNDCAAAPNGQNRCHQSFHYDDAGNTWRCFNGQASDTPCRGHSAWLPYTYENCPDQWWDQGSQEWRDQTNLPMPAILGAPAIPDKFKVQGTSPVALGVIWEKCKPGGAWRTETFDPHGTNPSQEFPRTYQGQTQAAYLSGLYNLYWQHQGFSPSQYVERLRLRGSEYFKVGQLYDSREELESMKSKIETMERDDDTFRQLRQQYKEARRSFNQAEAALETPPSPLEQHFLEAPLPSLEVEVYDLTLKEDVLRTLAADLQLHGADDDDLPFVNYRWRQWSSLCA